MAGDEVPVIAREVGNATFGQHNAGECLESPVEKAGRVDLVTRVAAAQNVDGLLERHRHFSTQGDRFDVANHPKAWRLSNFAALQRNAQRIRQHHNVVDARAK
ncbi:hypothetical protein D3C84_1054190 [compost metagenome]